MINLNLLFAYGLKKEVKGEVKVLNILYWFYPSIIYCPKDFLSIHWIAFGTFI